MNISIHKGDLGETRLYSGEKVSKNSPKVCLCGDIDELVSILGVAKQYNNKIHKEIEWIQEELFRVGSEISCFNSPVKLTLEDVKNLEKIKETMEVMVDIPKGFILPGSNISSAYLDWARSISRRCEREIVRAYELGLVENQNILTWMNRLSGYLYLLARYVEDKPKLVNIRK